MPLPRWQLDGQLALITGASAGIGRAIAQELLGLGARVRIVARGVDALDDARAELLDAFPDGDIQALAADMADDEQRRQVLDWVEDEGEGLHILINNAGGNLTRAAQDYTEAEWREIFEINLFSAFELSRYAYPLLTRHPASCIVNVGSVCGLTHVRSGAPYGMSKAALHQMTRNLAAEWAGDGVRVNAVSPGYTLTPAMQTEIDCGRRDPMALTQSTALGRFVETSEVANAVAFLSSPEASGITGIDLPVDAGWLVATPWQTYGGVPPSR